MGESEIERKGVNASPEQPPSPWAHSPKDLLGSPLNEQPKADMLATSAGKSAGHEAIHDLIIHDPDRSTLTASDVTPASESNSRRGPHGETITKHPGGVTVTDYPDGTNIIDTPDTRHTTRPDGTKTVVDKKTGRITTFVPKNVDPTGEGYRVDQMPGKPPEQHPYDWQPPVKPRWRQKIDDINQGLEEEYRNRPKYPREERLPPREPENI